MEYENYERDRGGRWLYSLYSIYVVFKCIICKLSTDIHSTYNINIVNTASIVCHVPIACIAEGSLEVTLPTIWTDGKAEVGRVSEKKEEGRRRRRRRRRKKEEEEEEKRKKKEEERRSGARKGRKVAKHFVFQNNTAHAMSACGRWGKRIQPPEADVSLENLLYRPSCFFCPLGGSGSDKDMPCF